MVHLGSVLVYRHSQATTVYPAAEGTRTRRGGQGVDLKAYFTTLVHISECRQKMKATLTDVDK